VHLTGRRDLFLDPNEDLPERRFDRVTMDVQIA
jgi:hypothetical protein